MTRMTFLLLVVFWFCKTQALVSALTQDERLKPNQNNIFEVCWAHKTSPYGNYLKKEIESYATEQLILAGIELVFIKNCFEIKDPFFPIGISFYDDPEITEGIRNVVNGYYSNDSEFKGHAYTFSKGVWVHENLVDINLTSLFEEVSPNLEAQSESLSEQGKLNLIKSIALHEILHAFGIVHEQNHKNSICNEPKEYGGLGLLFLTDYDPNSIMNYCNTHIYNFEKSALALSPLDIEGLKTLYQ